MICSNKMLKNHSKSRAAVSKTTCHCPATFLKMLLFCSCFFEHFVGYKLMGWLHGMTTFEIHKKNYPLKIV